MYSSKRFRKVHEEAGAGNWTFTIWQDTETGVNYVHYSAMGGSFTPLLDKEGKPIITDRYGC